MRAPDMSAESTEILWHENHNIYQPQDRPLADFLSAIKLTSPPPTLQPADNSLLIFIKRSISCTSIFIFLTLSSKSKNPITQNYLTLFNVISL